jgi:signal transduction histidine kinase
MTLVSVVLLSLMVPLITTFAEDRTQDLFVSRLADVTRFAVIAEDSLEGGDTSALDADLERYAQVYGGSVLVTNADEQVVAASGTEDGPTDDRVAEAVSGALGGRTSQPPPTAWPWREQEVLIASPVGRDAQVLGAVVLVAPTDPVQDSVVWWLALLTVAGLATLLLTAFGVVGPFVDWVMRPVHDLEDAAKRLADGDLTSRAHQTGPAELRELARTFNVMADNVETSQQQQRDLVADAAHQLGNPLTSLRLRVEELVAAGADPREVEIVLEETDRLNSIVEALLDLSQVGAHAIEPVPVDVAEGVRHRCEMWAPVFADLRVDAPAPAWALATDDLVDVVLDALLDNASKFAPGSPVEVALVETGERVLLSVRDHGAGLDPDDVPKVGARFFRGRRHQNVSGTGLGLAIVRARVADLGGTLAVRLVEGGGLQVEVGLVRVAPLRPAAPGSSAPSPGGAPPAR